MYVHGRVAMPGAHVPLAGFGTYIFAAAGRVGEGEGIGDGVGETADTVTPSTAAKSEACQASMPY